MKKLSDKIAIVTGAGSAGPGWGNGKAAAVLFAREGAAIVAVDVNPRAAQETCDLIVSEGGRCVAHTADVSQAANVAEAVARCIAEYGRVDVLHHNVGIVRTGGPVWHFSETPARWFRTPELGEQAEEIMRDVRADLAKAGTPAAAGGKQ